MEHIEQEYVCTVTKREFLEEWLKYPKDERNHKLFVFITNKYNLLDIPEGSVKEIKQNISRFSSKLAEKYALSHGKVERFKNNNELWLAGSDITFKIKKEVRPSTSTVATSGSAGRPRKEFEETSLKTKRRRVEDLLVTRTASELTSAAAFALRQEGHRTAAKQIEDLSVSSVNKTISGNNSNKCSESSRQLTPDEALAYYIDSKCTTHSYKQTRKWTMKAGHLVFPSYYSLSKSKESCCPPKEHISVTETRAEIGLQAILDKTAERLVEAQTEVIENIPPNCSLTLVSKYGCDGSSGHSTYKQKFENTEATDEFLFVFSFVPLRLYDNESEQIIWQNPRHSSTLYCRPIKFIFAKETTELTLTETNKLLEEISNLNPTLCNVGTSQISVKHSLLLTMTDGKICNALTNTNSAQKCYICGATPTMMNDRLREFRSNQDNYGFGLSTLHAWIRCFECLLHISYRLDIKKWQVRGDIDKASVALRTETIKQKFKNQMGLIVDKPKPGFGNSNDGNTARRFFSNAQLSSEITGIDAELIKKFNTILRALSSGYEINCEKFSQFCEHTFSLYLSLYSWYYMPATVHKILVHSSEVIKSCLLPIGQLSEEAQEARNKDCRRFREHNTRKSSRIATNTDLLRMLIITSDPLINSLRELPKKTNRPFDKDILELLMPLSSPSCPVTNTLMYDEDYLALDSSTCDSIGTSDDDNC